MEKLLIIAGLIALAAFLVMEYKRVKSHEAYDPKVERFRHLENLSAEDLYNQLWIMSTSDKESLLNVLINKSEHTENNRQLIKAIRIFLIEEQNAY